MCRYGSLVRAWAWAACVLSANVGCALHRCHFDRGEALGLHPDCDPHSAQIYRHNYCCSPFRDPRLPGPKVVSTLPAMPEMAGPSTFSPVPTYPVFGPRAEEPDGFDPQMLQLLPADGSASIDEPFAAPSLAESDEMVDGEDLDEESDPSELSVPVPGRSVEQAGWKPAHKRPADEAAARPCAKCTATFKRSPTLKR